MIIDFIQQLNTRYLGPRFKKWMQIKSYQVFRVEVAVSGPDLNFAF